VGARERLPVERGDVLPRGEGGHLEVLKWARANGCPWDENTCGTRRWTGRPRGSQVGARERLPVGRVDAPKREIELA
jgi:hypothetical protein